MCPKVSIAVVGLGFGEDFLPIYAAHPGVADIAIVDPSEQRLQDVGDRHGIAARFGSYDDVLADPRWDAVHIVAPVAFHADYAMRALQAGKHCACAVPMGLEIDELHAIVELERSSGRRYMMMETSVYGREHLFVDELYREGRLGTLTFYRGFHIQNLDGYPAYWQGYPPMKYLTHALSPLLALTDDTVADVVAYGSSRLTPDRVGTFENPFPVEVGLFRLRQSDVVGQVTMSFFQTARPYVEGFAVYGSEMSVEWPESNEGPLTVHELLPLEPDQPDTGLRGRRSRTTMVEPHDVTEILPESIRPYLRPYVLQPTDGRSAIEKLAEHGGSHPHLVHEFVSSILEDRPPAIDAATSAAWTAAGICAHDSALRGGERITVPSF